MDYSIRCLRLTLTRPRRALRLPFLCGEPQLVSRLALHHLPGGESGKFLISSPRRRRKFSDAGDIERRGGHHVHWNNTSVAKGVAVEVPFSGVYPPMRRKDLTKISDFALLPNDCASDHILSDKRS